jgi:hypothetical protein
MTHYQAGPGAESYLVAMAYLTKILALSAISGAAAFSPMVTLPNLASVAQWMRAAAGGGRRVCADQKGGAGRIPLVPSVSSLRVCGTRGALSRVLAALSPAFFSSTVVLPLFLLLASRCAAPSTCRKGIRRCDSVCVALCAPRRRSVARQRALCPWE